MPVASQAATHGVIDRKFGDRCLRKISMAGGTRNTRLVMRRVPEFHVSFGREFVDTYPRNFGVLVSVSDDFLHLGLFGAYLGVTEHAFPDRGNAGRITDVGTGMAIDALHSKLHVGAMWKSDRLFRCDGRSAICNEPQGGRNQADTAPALR